MALQSDYLSAPTASTDERRRHHGGYLQDAAWAARISRALDEQRLELSPQRITPLTGGAAREQLQLRMIDGDGNRVAAEAFLPAAERFGLVAHLDRWVVAKAVRFAAVGWIVHVRLSAASVRDRFMVDQVAHELSATTAPAANVVFEMPAGVLTSSAESGEAFATGMHALGCGLALHDVAPGTRPAQLARLRVKALTIDRHVVGELPHSARARRRAQAIVSLARELDVETIADGVDDGEKLELLRSWGVDYAHGDLIHRPAVLAG